MKIRYTLHVLERVRQRGISREEVESCLRSPGRIVRGRVSRCVKRLNNKALVVIFRVENDAIIVITAYRTSKLQKYL